MKNSSFHPIIGLEVHAELKTASKMFCGCKNDPFHASAPNTNTCPVCLGMPGALPVANKTAIEWTIKLGLALNCKINLFSKFDRKHYFYPDLPKGYQISQYDLPFCHDGYLDTSEGRVRIRRIHLEEDTAKLQHTVIDGKKVSLVDFNRSSVPLIEIVTEADVKTGTQAKEYGKKLRQIIRYLNIGDCDMEQGGMRLEANISLSPTPYTGQSDFVFPGYKVEVKNINSFRFVEQAIAYELERQTEVLEAGETPKQETRGFDSVKGITFSQRSKESAEDYRYFPDPDLPPIVLAPSQVDQIAQSIPELPEKIALRWQAEYAIPTTTALQLITSPETAKWFDTVFATAIKTDIAPIKLLQTIINKKIAVTVGDHTEKVIRAFQQLNQTDSVDVEEIKQVVREVLAKNPDVVEKYKAGKTAVLGFIIGQVMRVLKKKLDPSQVQDLVKIELQ